MYWLRNKEYTLIDGATKRPKQSRNHILLPLTSLVAIVVTFILGRLSMHMSTTTDILSFPTHPRVLMENYTFTEDTETAKQAWEEIFPKQLGFFTHPEVAPKRSTFSVYHYLHCLNGVREGYWMLYNMASDGERLNKTSLPVMASPVHIQHCIDLLRQALMCNPDLTVEVKNETTNGVHGFGVEHQCVDWDALRDWTSEWETFGQGGKEEHKHTHR